jgi:hypothetical protein
VAQVPGLFLIGSALAGDRVPEELPGRAGGGHGLGGMRERVQLTGGTLTVGPTTDGGWLVEAVLPRAPAPDPQP